jgi:hypothetical protein
MHLDALQVCSRGSFTHPCDGCTPGGQFFLAMKVTEEEMELLKVVLNGLTSTGPAIQLVNLWRQRGVEPSEFELIETKEKIPSPLSSPSTPSPSLHSLSSSGTPFLTTTPAKENHSPKETDTKKKLKLSAELVFESVPPDLTLQSPLFLKAWRRWIENRLQLPKPTLGAFEAHMTICKRLGESRAIAAINHSIASSYLSIYEPRRNQKPDNRDRVGASL